MIDGALEEKHVFADLFVRLLSENVVCVCIIMCGVLNIQTNADRHGEPEHGDPDKKGQTLLLVLMYRFGARDI